MNLLHYWLEMNQWVFVNSFCVLGTEVDMCVHNKGQSSRMKSRLWKSWDNRKINSQMSCIEVSHEG